MLSRLRRQLVLLAGAVLIGGCAVIRPPSKSDASEPRAWSGRLAVQAQAPDASADAWTFSAEFDVQGSAQAGELQLFSPLGTTLAEVSWQANAARLRSRGQVRDFADLDALMSDLLGVSLPSQALFAWLKGQWVKPTGWDVDLSQHAIGRISASKFSEPKARLTLVFQAHPNAGQP